MKTKILLLVFCAFGVLSQTAEPGKESLLERGNVQVETNESEHGVNLESDSQIESDRTLGTGLGGGPEPGDGEAQVEKKPAKRQFYLAPFQQQQPFPFVPIYIPYERVVTVHHVVMLQPPVCAPGTYPQQPGTVPQQPGSIPQQPGTFPQQPGTIPQQPGTYPQQPGTFPQQPGTLPQQPGVFPQQPGTFPQQPGTFPQQPGGQGPFPYPPATTPPSTGIDDRTGPMGGETNTTATKRPSRCVWAIVACCSPDSTTIRYSCFELLGCPGAFWGVNPCEQRIVQAAANTALNFYMTEGREEGDFSQNRV